MMRNQTISFLRQRFKENGIQPLGRFGQNFLIDPNLQQLLVEAAELTVEDVVLEIGTGTGGLTTIVAQCAAEVVTVEIDQHLYELASEQLIDYANVTMLHLDVLENKNRLSQHMLKSLVDRLQAVSRRQWKLVANLPFSVATPVLSNLLAGTLVPVTMTITIQKELADRILAQPLTKDYGALSVWIQSQCEARLIRVLSPSVFWPRPKVSSAIMHLCVNPVKRAGIPDLTYWHHFVRAMFFHRRKFLRGVLLAAFKNHLSKTDVDRIFVELGFSANTRTEQLGVDTMLAFCESVRARAPAWRLA